MTKAQEIRTLRPYQRDGGEAVEGALLDQHVNRVLLKMPTGTGKTELFARFIAHFPRLKGWLEQFPEKERRMLVVAHREELLDQAADKIQRANPDLIVCIEQGSRRASRYADVVVASIQSLAAVKFYRLRKLMASMRFRIVVVDEAHHAPAASYRTMLAILGFLPASDKSESTEIEVADYDDVVLMEAALRGWDAVAPKDRLLVGVTATPNRTDFIGLGCVFQTIAYSYDLKQAIEDGWLAPMRPWCVETRTNLDDVKMSAGDFNQKYLARAVNTATRNQLALAAWRDYADGLPTIGFSVDVEHAHQLATLFQADGVRALPISGETPKADRRIYLRNYAEGTVDALFNAMLLTEGTDLPRTACILHAKPTKSATLYEQMTGRGLRIDPRDPAGPDRLKAIAAGKRMVKPECVVIDIVDIARKHSLQTAGVLYGLPPTLNGKGKRLAEVADAFNKFREDYPNLTIPETGRVTLEQLGAWVKRIDVWAVKPLGEFGQNRVCRWTRVADDRYILKYPWADGTETLTVGKDMLGHYDVSLTLKPKDGDIRQRTIAAQVETPAKAGDLAEQFILHERRSIMKIHGAGEAWQQKRATPKQIGLLRRFKATIDEKTLTAGEATILIEQFFAHQGKKREDKRSLRGIDGNT